MKTKEIFNKIIKAIGKLLLFFVSGKFKKQQYAESETNATNNRTNTFVDESETNAIKKTWLNINLKNKLRLMLLKFVNDLQNKILTTYHIEINFQTIDRKSDYKLELLAELRSYKECLILINQLQSQISYKFLLGNTYETEIKNASKIKQIEDSFKSDHKKHTSMKFIFRQYMKNEYPYEIISVTDEIINKKITKDYRVNILKSGDITISTIQDLFAVEIDQTEFVKPKTKEEIDIENE